MIKLLIIYGSGEGQTAKIAERIRQEARALGHQTEIFDAKRLPPDFSLQEFDAVIVGASLHMDQHQDYIKAFVSSNLTALNAMPSAFFSVSLSAAAQKSEDQQAAHDLAAKFTQDSGWRPAQTAVFAGALKYRQYGFIKRLVMRWISKRAGGDTDTSRDFEYTDWSAVDVLYPGLFKSL